MWKDFFFEDGSTVGNGLVLDDGTKVGLKIFVRDATVFKESTTTYDSMPTKAKMTTLGKELITVEDVTVLLSNYGSGYTPYVARAGEELGRVVLGPGSSYLLFCHDHGFVNDNNQTLSLTPPRLHQKNGIEMACERIIEASAPYTECYQ
jgi:hypothetical protein